MQAVARFSFIPSVALAVSLYGATACKGDSVDLSPVTAHACIHGEHGPFEDVSAGPDGAGPDISAAHTVFVIDLEDGRSVSYTPRETQAHVFYTDPAAEYLVVEGGDELRPFASQDVTGECDYLSSAQAYDLEAGATVDLHFEAPTTGTIRLIVEAVDG